MKILDRDGHPMPPAQLPSMASADRPTGPKPTDAPIALVHRLTQVWNTGDIDSLDELLADNFTAHYRGTTIFGRDAWKLTLTMVQAHHTAITCISDELIAEGDLVAENWTWSSIERETNAHVLMYGVTLHRIAHGRVQEQWTVINILTPRQKHLSPA
jgi:predicted SnoaL-like aldol condensation-catalyzing enzyme